MVNGSFMFTINTHYAYLTDMKRELENVGNDIVVSAKEID
jgi:hypothetical protein